MNGGARFTLRRLFVHTVQCASYAGEERACMLH